MHVRQRLHEEAARWWPGASVLAVIDVATRRAVPIGEAWRAALERWLVPEF